MRDIFLIYKTTGCFNTGSFVLLGLGDDINYAIRLAIEFAGLEGFTLDSKQVSHLIKSHCTFGYCGGGDFVIRVVVVNKLINHN